MELDDLKNTWEEATSQAEKKENLNLEMIDQMTQTKYRSTLKKIAYPEIIGTIICFISVVLMGLNFGKLNTPFLQGLGIITSLLLLILPVISLVILWQFNQIGDVSKPYAETLKRFAIQKIRFFKFQQTSVVLSYILLGCFVILIPKLFLGKSISDNKFLWAFTIIFGYIFLFIFSRWVLKHYGKALQQAGELLKELDS